jgi:Ca2+-binding RTX toxin-like protein
MKRWLTAAVCGLSLLGCSPDTSSREPAPASAATSPPNSGRTAGPAPEEAKDAPQPSEPPARRFSELRCFGQRPTVVGTPFDDRLRGTRVNDVIFALGGNDVVSGLAERDAVCTGTGHDRVVDAGGRAIRRLHVKLGPGDDRMTVVGPSTIRAGAGDDTIRLAANNDTAVALGSGDDLLRAVPVVGDFISASYPCVSFRWATRPVRVHLARGRAAGQGRDRLVNIRCAVGSRFDDLLVGTERGDKVGGGGGLDLVRTGTGNDQLDGGPRADYLYAGPGYDAVGGGKGWDRLYGGPGPDIIAGFEDGDYLDGGAGDDYLYAGVGCGGIWQDPPPKALRGMMFDAAPNEVFGRAGNDFLAGERGSDRLDGGAGVDAGSGGYRDGRIDWITSLEIFDECDIP